MAVAFSRLLALALYAYEKGLPATVKAIKAEIKEIENDKPKLILPPSAVKQVKG
jgi:hypothetical protein